MAPSVIGQVTAVLTGRARPYTRPGSQSAIDKQPATVRIAIGPSGLAGDEQGDRRLHGGPDKAVHCYAQAHYPAWQAELGDLPVLRQPGAFGENLSVQGLTEHTLCLGDQLQIGDALLEVSQGRQPCWKLNDRFGVPDMARRVQQSLRTGWYTRVLSAGSVGAGDPVILVARPWPAWPLQRLMELLYWRCLDRAMLESALQLPLVPSWRRLIERRLAAGSVEEWEIRLAGPSAA